METSAKWFSKMAYSVWILPQVDFYRIFWPYDPRIECHGTRDSLRKSAQPTVAVIDSQSMRTGLAKSVKGIDGGKKIKGIKRHLAVDLNGFPLTIFISRANVHDSKGAIGLAIDTACKYPTIRLLKADNGYRGPLVKNLKEGLLVELECVKSNFGTSEFKPISGRWVVERTLSWLESFRLLNSSHRQRDCDGSVCNVYVAVPLIQLHPEFITDIFILGCPWQKLPSPRPIVIHLRPLVSVTMQPHCSLTARTHLHDAWPPQR